MNLQSQNWIISTRPDTRYTIIFLKNMPRLPRKQSLRPKRTPEIPSMSVSTGREQKSKWKKGGLIKSRPTLWRCADIVGYAMMRRKSCSQNRSQREHSLCLEKTSICCLQGRPEARGEGRSALLGLVNYSTLVVLRWVFECGLGESVSAQDRTRGSRTTPLPASTLPFL